MAVNETGNLLSTRNLNENVRNKPAGSPLNTDEDSPAPSVFKKAQTHRHEPKQAAHAEQPSNVAESKL